ncbi:unnamed protein product [Arctia plantaginis]|uniref:Uncharacterized protein n=1 Tax=Arctia plantaginis TaxID=874455 RepID=A0A8S0Z263_ARCPL|nr:unnamed protein product [Arctia plantaginis]
MDIFIPHNKEGFYSVLSCEQQGYQNITNGHSGKHPNALAAYEYVPGRHNSHRVCKGVVEPRNSYIVCQDHNCQNSFLDGSRIYNATVLKDKPSLKDFRSPVHRSTNHTPALMFWVGSRARFRSHGVACGARSTQYNVRIKIST